MEISGGGGEEPNQTVAWCQFSKINRANIWFPTIYVLKTTVFFTGTVYSIFSMALFSIFCVILLCILVLFLAQP
jgi:cellulose synthase/poly-beta-1,6-N-acetylglucosamine synthase-like glycosyltransferase